MIRQSIQEKHMRIINIIFFLLHMTGKGIEGNSKTPNSALLNSSMRQQTRGVKSSPNFIGIPLRSMLRRKGDVTNIIWHMLQTFP